MACLLIALPKRHICRFLLAKNGKYDDICKFTEDRHKKPRCQPELA